ncbi:MAG: glycosyltransferase family 2 protein [Kiloniellaceae bacterium]
MATGTGSSRDTSPALSVVIPAHDEAANIAALVAEIAAALAGVVPYEIVVVDDGSNDGMAACLDPAAAEGYALRVVRHRVRSGQSAAVLSGVRAARAPWIVTLDGDGQNDPADIPRLWAMVQETGPDPNPRAAPRPVLIAGHRVRRRDTWSKRVSSRVANAVRGRLLGDRTPDTGCGLKVFPRAAFLSLPAFDHMHRFLPALFRAAGHQVVSVPVNHRPRGGGRSHYGMLDRLRVGIVDLFGVLWLRARWLSQDGERPD